LGENPAIREKLFLRFSSSNSHNGCKSKSLTFQESSIVAISAEHPPLNPPCRSPELPGVRLQQLIDSGALYIARNLSAPQFATLQAIASRIIGPRHPEHLAGRPDSTPVHSISISSHAPAASPNFEFRLGLDELDTITRTRTGYAFAELPDEIQDAILGLVTSRDLTSRKLDLAFWLEQLYVMAAAR
jgi:hypothetical protein